MVRWMGLLAVVALLATSCGHVPPGVGAASASGTASPVPLASPSPEPTPCVSAPVPRFPASSPDSRNFVIAKLRGSDQTVISDITDIAHPSTVAILDRSTVAGLGLWLTSVRQRNGNLVHD